MTLAKVIARQMQMLDRAEKKAGVLQEQEEGE
jgi:hypothetical protein